MSGRALHLRDGTWITNRKTERRQSPRRPLLERLHDLNARAGRRWPSRWVPDVRVGFIAPRWMAGTVAPGDRGNGVVLHRGFVQITDTSAERCFDKAQAFFAATAKHRQAFTLTVSVVSPARPDEHYGRWLVVVRGAVVVCRGHGEPKVFEKAA